MALSDSALSASPRRHEQARPLAEAIAAQTRGIHARVNRSITARLPLLLPPRASDPSIYVTGLLHIAPIYLTFEGLWDRFLAPDGIDPNPELVSLLRPVSETALVEASPLSTPALPQHNPKLPAREHSILHCLYLPGLTRGSCLKADIQTLTGWSDHVLETQLEIVCRAPPLAAIIEHMTTSIQKNPLLLITYAYIMYMALFAGGRVIRATLESTGDEFWQTPLAPVKPSMQPCIPAPDIQEESQNYTPAHNDSHKCHRLPLSFFHFDTTRDGEDLKEEFKSMVRFSEEALRSNEVDDIVQEATVVFEHIISIVQQLDAICEDDPIDSTATTPGEYLQSAPLLSRLRNSVAVAKERHAKSSPGTSSSEGDSAGTVIRRRNYRCSLSSGSLSTDSAASEHPPMPAITGVELCPAAAVRSVRFNSALSPPQSNEQSVWVGRREQLKTADLTSCVLAALLGIVAMGVILVSKRGSVA